uniref:Cell wall protein-like n=1 Tax=Oryza sativa subsp. japonica TaxID=39947 RepID=Q6K6D7_ORYSJ|nr:cell wall protein-like [Oryza sativa Japonica Group]
MTVVTVGMVGNTLQQSLGLYLNRPAKTSPISAGGLLHCSSPQTCRLPLLSSWAGHPAQAAPLPKPSGALPPVPRIPLPRSPVVAPPLPAVLLLSPTPPAASSRPYRLARAPSGRAVSSLGSATPSPSPASPSPLPKLAGTVSSSTFSGVATTPPPPAACAASQATASPEFRRNAVARADLSFLLVDVAFGSLFRRARAPADVTISTSGITAARSPSASPPLRPNPAGVRHRRHRSSSLACHLAAPPPSSASQQRVPRHPRLRAAADGCPCRLLAGPDRRHRRPLVVPGFARCVAHLSVKPIAFVIHVHQASRCSPVVVFVLGSASSSLVPAMSRLHPRIAAEVVPSPFVSVIPGRLRRTRSSLSFPRLVTWWFPKRGLRSSPKVRKAVISEQGKSHHP